MCSLVNKTLIGQVDEVLHNPFMDEIDRIDQRLHEMQCTWADLARSLNLTDQRVWNWRSKERRSVPKSSLDGVARFIGRSIDWITVGDKSVTGSRRVDSDSAPSRERAATVDDLIDLCGQIPADKVPLAEALLLALIAGKPQTLTTTAQPYDPVAGQGSATGRVRSHPKKGHPKGARKGDS